MHYLVIDGNSLVNRAFFAIKLLTAKDGHYTNAIFGFMNMLLSLVEKTKPDGIAVAFDVHQPTFRHEMYDAYKAGRKGMPTELREQMEPLKEILRAYGCRIVECPGHEADDILGTLAANTPAKDMCYIATGDRDSLQLIRDNVHVLLTATKMGQTVTSEYDPSALFSEYGLTPPQMIELKALQGDSSDNIPGVPGIGPKTAGELIKKYQSVDRIYDELDTIDVTNGVREKLRAGKNSAYLSRVLGTIETDAPIETDIKAYLLAPQDKPKLKAELARHEMFKLITRLGLDTVREEIPAAPVEVDTAGKRFVNCDAKTALAALDQAAPVYVNGFKVTSMFSTVSYLQNGVVTSVTDQADAITELLKTICESEGIAVRTTDAKALYKFAYENGFEVKNLDFDLPLAAYLLNPNADAYSVSETALSYHVPLVKVEGTDDLADEERAAAEETAVLDVLTNRLLAALEENDQVKLLREMEIPLARVLASMELVGMAVDRQQIEGYSVVLSSRIEALQQEIYDLAGESFNVNSPKQLGTILFEKLHLPAKKKTKSGYSTNADVLEELRDDYPIVDKVLEYRAYAKLKGTYCDGLLKAIADDGRIHSTFNQTETRTGRLSSTEPNLQNIPVRTELGREFRKFFVAKDGYKIVDADYSQIELRVLAALADDKNMIDCFNQGVDVHTLTASKVFGVPVENVTSTLRSRAKAVNFGIIYGIGAFSLAKDIHVSRAEADTFIKAYLALYSSIDAYMVKCIDDAKKNGYAVTLFGRRRYLPELASSNHMLRAFGERVARNMPIQGTAADIIKIAMVRVHDRLEKELPEVKLIMQVHDELILEAPDALAEKASAILKEEMENAVRLKVAFSVDVGVGETWYEAKG
ncbi:MAG: DNA polymerase I [Clostridia bacterium]|nr:DNA polymerase I [Clostridia bacterium]